MKKVSAKLIFTATFIGVRIFASDIEGKITVDEFERNYIIHLPKNYSSLQKYPLVLVFHGGGGNAWQIRNYTRFNTISDRENFIVAYPDALNRNWNDGREGEKLPDTDDVKFISELINTIGALWNVDTSRIFATGISNGGFFSIYLAYKLSGKILAIAPVAAAIPENYAHSFRTEYPVSLLLINGTDDRLVKYHGGEVGLGKHTGRGKNISTDRTIEIWTANNNCQNSVKIEKLDDKDKDDGCKATRYTYYNCSGNTEVILIKIKGGGHSWPGAKSVLPKIIAGNTCMDFSATEIIWEFFKSRSPRN
jgi:polyhydroxybutyrate depolymerase